MDLYYETEKSLMADVTKLARRIVCTGKKDIAALVIVLEEFFTLDASGWRNNRCEAEIAAYRARGISAAAAGKASAAKRSAPGSGSEEPALNADSTTVQRQSNDGSTDVQRKSNQPEPEPEPEPEPNKTHAVVDNEDNAQANEQPARVSKAGAICMVIKSEGIGLVNPQNPKLLALIDKGADVGHFAEAAKATSAKGKGFGYLLAVVEGQMREAAQMSNQALASPTARSARPQPLSFAERDRITAMQLWEERHNEKHPDLPNEFSRFKPNSVVIDVTPTNLSIAA